MSGFKEKWKDIPGYDGDYKISNKGRIISYKRNKKRFITLQTNEGGYLYKILCNDGKQKGELVSRLVAKAFVPNPKNKPCVNHIDGNKKNNFYTNLEWCTYSENVKHAYESGLWSLGEKHKRSVLTRDQVLEIRSFLWMGCFSEREIATAYNVSRGAIRSIITGKTWQSLGEFKCDKRKSTHGSLSKSDVLDIKDILDDSKETQTKIAERYGVDQSTISRIKNGDIWNHV